MSSALQFVRTPSGLTILLGFKPYTVASTDPIFPSVLSLIQANSSEADVLAVIELGKSVAQPIAPAVATPSFAVDEQGGDADEPVLVLTGLSVRGGYVGQNKDGAFDVLGDGEYLTSFDSEESATHYAEIFQHRFDTVVVEDEDGVIAAFGDTSHVVMASRQSTGEVDTSEQDELDEESGGDEEDEDYYRVCNDAGELLESFSDENEAMEYAREKANEYNVQVIIKNNSGDFLDAVDPEGSNAEEPVFEVFGEGFYLDEFSTQAQAVAYAEGQRGRYRKLEVVETHSQADDIPVAKIEGFLGTFRVVVDHSEFARMASQVEAKQEAIRLFGTGRHGRVEVLNSDSEDVLLLES